MIVLSIEELFAPEAIRKNLLNLKRLGFDKANTDYKISNTELVRNDIDIKALHWLINQPVCDITNKNAGMQDIRYSIFHDLKQNDSQTLLRLHFNLTD